MDYYLVDDVPLPNLQNHVRCFPEASPCMLFLYIFQRFSVPGSPEEVRTTVTVRSCTYVWYECAMYETFLAIRFNEYWEVRCALRFLASCRIRVNSQVWPNASPSAWWNYKIMSFIKVQRQMHFKITRTIVHTQHKYLSNFTENLTRVYLHMYVNIHKILSSIHLCVMYMYDVHHQLYRLWRASFPKYNFVKT